MSDNRRDWAVGSSEYLKRAARAATTPIAASPVAAGSPSAAAQREMTGIQWDEAELDVGRIRHVGVEKARRRFRAALPELIWNAAALEGNTFTLPEVRTLLDGTTVHGKPLEDEKQVLALSEGYRRVDELVGAGRFVLDKKTSDEVHALVARHEAIQSGHFRGEGSVRGGGTVRLADGGSVAGIPQEELQPRWERLMDELQEIPDPRMKALVYNAAATRSQYYFDGNKRTARLMMAGTLMASGFDVVNIPNSRRLEFNVALDQLFQTDDATQLMAFTISCAAAGSTPDATPDKRFPELSGVHLESPARTPVGRASPHAADGPPKAL